MIQEIGFRDGYEGSAVVAGIGKRSASVGLSATSGSNLRSDDGRSRLRT
jgi:hypothetical protein